MQTHIKTGESNPASSPGYEAVRLRRRRWLVVGVGFGILALVGALLAWQPWTDSEPDPAPLAAVELSLGENDALASCLAFDPAVLAAMPMAFEGTAIEVGGDEVTLEVTQWFTGGDAESVRLIGGHSSPALIAGFDFVPGEQYLISAGSGNVNYCGYSGPASAELRAGYEAAFPGN